MKIPCLLLVLMLSELVTGKMAFADIAPPAPLSQNLTKAVRVTETVRVVNASPYKIEVELSSEAPNQPGATAKFGPVAPGAKGEGKIEVWTSGAFTVLATWEANGTKQRSRPYTANLTLGEPVTPVTVTLTTPYDSGTLGVWTGVTWDAPTAK